MDLTLGTFFPLGFIIPRSKSSKMAEIPRSLGKMSQSTHFTTTFLD